MPSLNLKCFVKRDKNSALNASMKQSSSGEAEDTRISSKRTRSPHKKARKNVQLKQPENSLIGLNLDALTVS
jgi:hypothetical protein